MSSALSHRASKSAAATAVTVVPALQRDTKPTTTNASFQVLHTPQLQTHVPTPHTHSSAHVFKDILLISTHYRFGHFTINVHTHTRQ